MTLQGVLLMGEMQKQATANDFLHHSKGPPGELRAGNGTARSISDHLTPARPDNTVFIPTGDIGGHSWKRRGVGRCGQTRESARGIQGG